MGKKHFLINKCISILYRLSNPYFDKHLDQYHVGCGQQVFLLYLSKNPGASFQELAASGMFDKATATRAVKKLAEEGYVRLEMDESDRRVRHIYLTKEAEPVIEAAWDTLESWTELLTEGFKEEEKNLAENMLLRMVKNVYDHIEKVRKEEFRDSI